MIGVSPATDMGCADRYATPMSAFSTVWVSSIIDTGFIPNQRMPEARALDRVCSSVPVKSTMGISDRIRRSFSARSRPDMSGMPTSMTTRSNFDGLLSKVSNVSLPLVSIWTRHPICRSMVFTGSAISWSPSAKRILLLILPLVTLTGGSVREDSPDGRSAANHRKEQQSLPLNNGHFSRIDRAPSAHEKASNP